MKGLGSSLPCAQWGVHKSVKQLEKDILAWVDGAEVSRYARSAGDRLGGLIHEYAQVAEVTQYWAPTGRAARLLRPVGDLARRVRGAGGRAAGEGAPYTVRFGSPPERPVVSGAYAGESAVSMCPEREGCAGRPPRTSGRAMTIALDRVAEVLALGARPGMPSHPMPDSVVMNGPPWPRKLYCPCQKTEGCDAVAS